MNTFNKQQFIAEKKKQIIYANGEQRGKYLAQWAEQIINEAITKAYNKAIKKLS